MTEITAKFLNLLFDRDEEICVSSNKYGYHSIAQDALNGIITLISPNADIAPMTIREEDINLIAVNPIKGFRTDKNVTAYRSFMVENDTGSLESQLQYIKESKVPYSAIVFSGNKSMHVAITLEEPLPSIQMWRFYNQWLLNVLLETDQQIKNPSRSIRFPGNKRKDGKQLIQSMVELRGRVTQEEFFRWLFSHEDKKPVQRQERYESILTGIPDITKIPKDVHKMIGEGVEVNRNATWFYIGCCFAERGFDIYSAMDYLRKGFQEDNDFKMQEWEGCIKSAYSRIVGRDHVKEN